MSLPLLGLFLLWHVEGESSKAGRQHQELTGGWFLATWSAPDPCAWRNLEPEGRGGCEGLLRGEKQQGHCSWCRTLPGISCCLAMQLGLWWPWINNPGVQLQAPPGIARHIQTFSKVGMFASGVLVQIHWCIYCFFIGTSLGKKLGGQEIGKQIKNRMRRSQLQAWSIIWGQWT